MANLSVVYSQVQLENKTTINSFLRGSYIQAKRQLQDGLTIINESVSSMKGEFSFIYDRTSGCLNTMTLPVNNFLKDLSQIDIELQKELSVQSGELIILNGILVPVAQALLQPMEENY